MLLLALKSMSLQSRFSLQPNVAFSAKESQCMAQKLMALPRAKIGQEDSAAVERKGRTNVATLKIS